MKRIENNKATISHTGDPFQKIKSLISSLREGLRGAGGPFSGGLLNLLTTSCIKIPLWGLVGSFLLFSCLEDRDNANNISPDEEADPEFTLSVTIPGIHTSTRSLSEADESSLEAVHIFVFRDNGEGSEETYLYHTHATDIVGQGNQWNFKVYLQKSETDVKHRIVLLANLKNEVEEADQLYNFNTSQTKEEVLSSITFFTDVAWRTTDPVRTLPMWGQSDTTYLITGTTKGSDLPVIHLMRSVARIDVGVNLTTADQPRPLAKNTFTLKDVYIYNVKDKGAVAPADSCYDGAGGTDLKGVVTKPTIPSSAGRMTTPIHYTQVNPANLFFREIYLSEADNIAFPQEAVSIVIGGYFTPEGESANQTEMTYYRIDLYDTSAAIPERFDLLRNHRYRINILALHGPGYASKEIAVKEPPINIDSEIEVNEEGVILDMVYNGQHYLGVNKALFELSGEAWGENETTDANLLIVNTTYPDGWKVSSIMDPDDNPITDWLKVSLDNGPVKTQTKVRLLLAENKTGINRTGSIHLEAGDLKHTITVSQAFRTYLYVKDKNGVEITDGDTLYYESGVMGNIPAQIVDLEWSPGDLEVALETGYNPFTFDPVNDELTNGDSFTGGYKILNLQAAVMDPSEYAVDPFLVKETAVIFRVAGTTLSRRIILKQEKKGIVENACFFPTDGEIHRFTVKSNTLWNVSIENNQGVISQLITTTGGNKKEGELLSFRTEEIHTPYEGSVVFRFTSPLNEFPDKLITVRGGTGDIVDLSNSYIVKPGSMGIRIPVGRANEHTTFMGQADAIGNTDIITAEMLWTDNSYGMSCAASVISVDAIGTGNTGYVQVWPGDVSGNAVVAVKVNNVVKWSWHIWVTDYQPGAIGSYNVHYNAYADKQHAFMDRNLGALTNEPGDIKAVGLLYQWSRKDPFPGAKEWGKEETVPVYNAAGEEITIPAATHAISDDIHYNVENPTVFTMGFPSVTSYVLWGNRTEDKTIYDPCPEDWRVPNSEGYRSPWYWEDVRMNSDPATYGATWNYGWVFEEDYYPLGYYPAAGVRTGVRIQRVGGYGRYWTTLPHSTGTYGWAWILEMDNDNYHEWNPWSFGVQYYGTSVRCVKDITAN